MKESILKEIVEGLEQEDRNYYQTNISLNLLEVAKRNLEDFKIKFEPYIFKQKERLKIYYTPDDYYKYYKNFYQNNCLFGFKISNDKLMTEKFLKYSRVPTTNSILLNTEQFEEAVKTFRKNSDSKVVRPLNLSNGPGVLWMSRWITWKIVGNYA